MKVAEFSFDANLSALLSPAARIEAAEYRFSGPQTSKHLIESLGIPHTEIGRVLVYDRDVGLGYLVQDQDRLTIEAVAPQKNWLEAPRFVLDGHLGKLTARLRMLGLDCVYGRDCPDPALAGVAISEARILLTRDRRLLMRKCIEQGYLVRSLDTDEQLRGVIRRFGLRMWIRPFKRCIRCNHLLEPIEKQYIIDRLQPLTRQYFDEFHSCPACGQLYWKGSHVDKMQDRIASLLETADD